MVTLFKHVVPLCTDDVLYNALPLYHSNGGVLTMGQSYTRGLTVALRKKFSASQFFKDCSKYNCTVRPGTCRCGYVCLLPI